MENPEQQVKDIIITEINFKIIYDNDAEETIEKTKEGYKILYDAWLVEQPMFISDIYKTQMRDLNFASRGNQSSINQLNLFIDKENKTEVIKFFNYMRNRDLTFEKNKWT
jgi:hypothetical protein